MSHTGRLLDEQLKYYTVRALDYDEWVVGYMRPVRAELIELLSSSPLRGQHVLELACGTGYWTHALSGIARHVTAVDGAPQMLDIARRRRLENVEFIEADLFGWRPPAQWDGVFFANWLAHVPPQRMAAFWSMVADALRPGGSVVFIDVTGEEKVIEEEILQEAEIPLVRRRVKDGRRFKVIKAYWEPEDLLAELRHLGWNGTAQRVGEEIGRGFVYYRVEKSITND
jgi:ubiquinone/menaquinone biosynthesis C-methylase UbiE